MSSIQRLCRHVSAPICHQRTRFSCSRGASGRQHNRQPQSLLNLCANISPLTQELDFSTRELHQTSVYRCKQATGSKPAAALKTVFSTEQSKNCSHPSVYIYLQQPVRFQPFLSKARESGVIINMDTWGGS